MTKNDNTSTEKPAKKLTAEQKAKAKEKLAKKRAALKEKLAKKRAAKKARLEKKRERLAKKRAAKKMALILKKQKKHARLEKKRERLEKIRAAKKARLEKKRARIAAKKAKAKELKAKQKAKAVKKPKTVVEIEKADLRNIPTKDMAKELTKRLKTFAKVLADRKNDAAEREELEKRIEKDGIQVSVLDGVLVARLFITAEARVTGPAPQIAKRSAIEPEQPKENAAEPAAETAEKPEGVEIPAGDTYGNEPTDADLDAIEREAAEAENADEEDEEQEEDDPRSEVDDDQAEFRREFFGNAENTEDFE